MMMQVFETLLHEACLSSPKGAEEEGLAVLLYFEEHCFVLNTTLLVTVGFFLKMD